MAFFKRKPAPKAQVQNEVDDRPFWKRKTMREMTSEEWESLCDGCGRCCLNKLIEEETDKLYYTDVGCRLLDGESCRCKDYKNRAAKVRRLRRALDPQHQPHQLAAADLRLQARRRGQGSLLVAPAGVGRPRDSAPGRRLDPRQDVGDRKDGARRQARRVHRELADEMAEGEQGVGARTPYGRTGISSKFQ